MKKECILLIGNIGTGKSTFAKEFVNDGYVIISRDALRYMIGAGKYIFDIDLEPIIWKSEKTIIRNFMDIAIPILIDKVGISKIMREEYLRLAYTYHYKTIAIVLPRISRKIAVDRRMKNSHGQPDRKLWESVYDKFEKQFEMPTKKEGFNQIIQL